MNITLHRMTPADSGETIEWITRQYCFNRDEVASWVEKLHFNWPLSVKAVDENGKTVGLLNMSDYRIEEETSVIADEQPDLLQRVFGQGKMSIVYRIERSPHHSDFLHSLLFPCRFYISLLYLPNAGYFLN